MKSKQLKTKTQLMDNILDLDGFQAVIIAADDKVIFEYGNIKYDHGYLASCRKSVLAILYGMYPINLDKTLDELKIDDKSPLSSVEKTATIRNLLMARSGIYHPASNEGDDKDKPARHSKKPGEYFVYNNWDFNVLRTIFEQETKINIYDALDHLGKLIGFKDFDLEFNKKDNAEFIEKNKPTAESIHPPYHMFISARDMLKIGYLMLNEGMYDGIRVVPKKWIKLITQAHTVDTRRAKPGDKWTQGYGYMWWVYTVDKKHPLYGGYAAQGNDGQNIIIIPKSNMVIVTKYYLRRGALLKKVLNIK